MDRPKPRDDNSAAININIQPQQSTMTTQTTKLSPTGFTGTGVNTSFSSTSSSTTHHQHYPSSTYDVHHRREVDNSLITSPNRTDNHSQQSTLGQSIGENGSVFTLTNIYTFADNSNNSSSLNDINNRGGDGLYSRTFDQTHRNMGPNSDKYTIKSIVEVFDKPEQETEIDKLIRETHTSSEHRLTRKTRTSGSDTTDFGGSSRYYHGQSTSITPTSQSKYSVKEAAVNII
ncbi:unnamed protein product [Didymodactylos carnosus]|uniref:Uncharacterized protein n=1 Tax=Didymodactylos carnosus TaxID=1234261 RepID=A0A8S2E2M5_9BILA|nr:unnamed protein product [Didymodactylos carnosus]CAF3820082.1 unnamed protein product [Didymodactylos carnosus]